MWPSPWLLTSRPVALCAWLALFAGVIGVIAVRCDKPSERRVAIRVACTDCALVESVALDTWSDQRAEGMPLDVVVRAKSLPVLAEAGVRWEVIVPDIDEAARAERQRLQSSETVDGDWFAEYRDYTAISAHLEALVAHHPDLATLHGIGSTLDGRPIWALRIGGGATPMLINGTQHAREWIAAMVTTCVADRLITEYDRDPAVKRFVDGTTLWVVPVVNPDGYQYSWSTDRYWRKTRRGGFGVDLNRNFAVGYGGGGSSGSKRSIVYRGEYAFSEPESAALRDLALREKIALHVDFHSYGQLVMYPWMYSSARVPDRDRFAAVGDRMASAMFAAHETRYRLVSGVETSPTGGTMTDWMYGEAHALSFTVELRPRGGSGFVLPPEQIRPTCDEGLAAVLALRSAQP
ncbi:MAG: M14 family zinc carboxypeptidase [Kofleriaceae bacterium]|nr:M14 family zinc carboxypeptidase [Kofleriaceae bacterium]